MALTIYSIAAIIMILQKRINTNIGFYTYIKERYNGILDKYERIMQSCNVDPMTLEIANIVENNELEIICDNDTYYISNYEVKCAFLETILRKETGWLQEGNNKKLETSILKEIMKSTNIIRIDPLLWKEVSLNHC